MATSYVEIEDKYKPKTANEQISISVEVGDAQNGAYVIFLGTKLKGSNTTASMGTQSDVLGKNSIISATVVDVMEETNWTSVTVKIKEGSNEQVYGPYSKEVATHLDTVCFIIKILNTND